MHEQKIKAFQKTVLDYYKKEGRVLPWRETKDPYRIMVSEIMLQQTQVDRVIPKYQAFLEKFPTVQALAEGSTADVLRLWSGLGYNNRAIRLQKAAQMLLTDFSGKFPTDPELLMKLPGIGPYTSRSILIFSQNKNIATVDTNIRRILIHEFDLDEKINDKELFALAEEVLPYGKSRDWHNALMDYGSTILTSRKTGIKAKTQQSKFKGSRRWYRGDLLKRLVAGEKVNIPYLQNQWDKKAVWVEELVQEMTAQGLISFNKQRIKLKE